MMHCFCLSAGTFSFLRICCRRLRDIGILGFIFLRILGVGPGELAAVAGSGRFFLRIKLFLKLCFESFIRWKNNLVIELVMAYSPGDPSIIAAACVKKFIRI